MPKPNVDSLVNEIFMSQTLHAFNDMREDVHYAIYELEHSSLMEFDDVAEESKKIKDLNVSLPNLLEGFDTADILGIDAAVENLPSDDALSNEERKFVDDVSDLINRLEPLREKCKAVSVLANTAISDVTDIHSNEINLTREDEVLYLPELFDSLEKVSHCVTSINELCETVYAQAARVNESKE